jgi:transposase-like protein
MITATDVVEARTRAWLGENIKSIARELDAEYHQVYNAVRGKSWSKLTQPPPVPAGYRPVIYRICINEMCGDVYTGNPNNGLCPACYSYWYRNGRLRHPDRVWDFKKARVGDVEGIYRQYARGASLAQLADELPCCAETLRRRFVERGYEIRRNTEHVEKLTAAKARQVRKLVHEDGMEQVRVARMMGVSNSVVFEVVHGLTWKAAGGRMAATGGVNGNGRQKCGRCGLLTDGELCAFCRKETADMAGEVKVTAVTLSLDVRIAR